MVIFLLGYRLEAKITGFDVVKNFFQLPDHCVTAAFAKLTSRLGAWPDVNFLGEGKSKIMKFVG